MKIQLYFLEKKNTIVYLSQVSVVYKENICKETIVLFNGLYYLFDSIFFLKYPLYMYVFKI